MGRGGHSSHSSHSHSRSSHSRSYGHSHKSHNHSSIGHHHSSIGHNHRSSFNKSSFGRTRFVSRFTNRNSHRFTSHFSSIGHRFGHFSGHSFYSRISHPSYKTRRTIYHSHPMRSYPMKFMNSSTFYHHKRYGNDLLGEYFSNPI